MEKIDNDIQKARKNLRNIYSKYSTELYEIAMKIDKMLEVLQINGKETKETEVSKED